MKRPLSAVWFAIAIIMICSALALSGCSRGGGGGATSGKIDPAAVAGNVKDTIALLERDPPIFTEARLMACESLGKMGAAASSALPTLEKIAKEDTEESVKKAAAEAIKQIKAGGA